MALSDSQKVDILWKALQKRADSSTAKAFYEEANFSVSSILNSQIWTYADQIPTPASTTSTSLVTYHPSVLMTVDVTVTGNKSYTTPLKNWIHPSIDPSYQLRLYQNNGSGGLGAEVPPTDTSDWVFDYNSGTLTFFNDNSSHAKPYLIKGWRYVGATGVVSSGGAASYYSATFLSTEWASEVAGVSRSITLAHGLGTADVIVDVFVDLGSGSYTPTSTDWIINSTSIKLLIADTAFTPFTGKIDVRPMHS